MELDEKIKDAIEAPLENLGYDVVYIKIKSGRKIVLVIDIDRIDGCAVTVDDCVKANELISALLDVQDFIKSSYTLEVSSPGEWRQISKIKDYQRFLNNEVKIELYKPIDGIYKFFGKLLKVDENDTETVVYLLEECNNIEHVASFQINLIKKTSVKRFF